MKDYRNYASEIELDFNTLPKYENERNSGEIISAELRFVINIDEKPEKLGKLPNGNPIIEYNTSQVDLSLTLDSLFEAINLIDGLNPTESTGFLTPFISIDGDPDDLGIWWNFTKMVNHNEQILEIEMDFRTKEKIVIKTNRTKFRTTMVNFAIFGMNSINEIRFPETYRVNIAKKFENLKK